jgi:hypothetical protein
MRRKHGHYKRRLIGRAYFRKFYEFTVAVGFGLLTFFFAHETNIMGAATDIQMIEAAARSTGTEVGTVQPVMELIKHIMERVGFALEVIIALIAALIAFTVAELVSRVLNVEREVTLDNLYEADTRVVELVDTILEASTRFQNAGRDSPRVQALLSEYLDLKKESFVGFLQRIADLDIDIDSGSERSFTTSLVEIAESRISAVSVDEEEFYSGEDDAEEYLRQQINWLSKSESREITRVFVAPRPERSAESEKFKKMIDYHAKLLAEWSGGPDKSWATSISRYRYRTISWKDFIRIMKEDADLVIYDDRFIRKGILGPDETRRAQFRANSADVVEAVMKFRDICATAASIAASIRDSGAAKGASEPA